MQQSMIPGYSWVFHQWELHLHRKTVYRKFDGNGQGTDVMK